MSSNLNLSARFTAAKKGLFERLYCKLNSAQREAVFSVNGPLLVIAGAGSGKTTVLTRRIAHILRYGDAYEAPAPSDLTLEKVETLECALQSEEINERQIADLLLPYAVCPCRPWEMLAITFTNKAANEIKNRLAALLHPENADGTTEEDAQENPSDSIWAGTFHSICMRILHRYGDHIGLTKGFVIYDTDDSKRVIAQCLKKLGVEEKTIQPKVALNRISRAKDSLLTPEVYALSIQNSGDYIGEKVADIYRLYQKYLTESNAVDFDDIIQKTVMLLQNDEEVRLHYQNQFRYVCVDEYQDTNHAQFVLASLLSGGRDNLMVVGDDDQSIYRFRGADIENILQFDRLFQHAKVIKLEENYRSTKNILAAANSVIANNNGRHRKTLFTAQNDGDKLISKRLDSPSDEARFIVNRIMDSYIREKRHYRDFAILYRVNAQAGSLENVLTRSGIPYRIVGTMHFYERKEIKDIIAYLCVVNNPYDNLHLLRIINEPKRKIGETTVRAVEAIAAAQNRSLFDVMKHAGSYTVLQKTAPKLRDFTDLIEGLRSIGQTERVSTLIEKTLDLTGYRSMILMMGESEMDRLQNLQELLATAIEYEKRLDEAGETPSLEGFLEEIALVSDIDNYDTSADAISLMTVHSAKGLEFPVVFLPGFEEGLFPGSQAQIDPEELEEERRLAYVALTRAKERLIITHVKERMLYGHTTYNQPSRFLEEIPSEYLQDETEQPASPSAKDGITPPQRTETRRSRKPVISKEFFKKSDLATAGGRSNSYIKFQTGDLVTHASFGKGEVLVSKEMGGDILYEIAFDSCGTKKLMATYAKLRPFHEDE